MDLELQVISTSSGESDRTQRQKGERGNITLKKSLFAKLGASCANVCTHASALVHVHLCTAVVIKWKAKKKCGAVKRGAAKRGAAKRGAAKRGAAKRGAAKRGAAKHGAAKRGAVKREAEQHFSYGA
ncbi:hypothetical protein POVWA2_019840 [Plasmodium ovale wallikeri]|uniref:Uncharacterized protein n=1 Tax=Plasmodium ovale wallikeri TaxID=864142 RepID=A0A1A8YSC7_PLAOA|nr:hypothetical protein POVWA1_019650 [Plasmodium ovale wallikeri]SBT34441.1 hypothetical protein POVWA2_019840 [Plasmodium ovale wallikeri]